MQGQRGAIGSSLPDSINFDLDQQICWNNMLTGSASGSTSSASVVGQEGHNLRRWSIGESSSANLENLNQNHDDERVWPPPPPSSSINASVVVNGLRLDEERDRDVSDVGVNLNLNSSNSNHPSANGPMFMRSLSSSSNSGGGGAASQSHDLSEGRRFARVGEELVACPNSSSKSLGFETRFLSSASTSSDPFGSSSGSGGFLVEEDDGRPGCSMDGRRVSCKRKTLEGNGGQSSSGGFLPRVEGGTWHAVPSRHDAGSNLNIPAAPESSPSVSPSEPVNSRLGLGMSGGVSGDSLRPPTAPIGPDSLRRNYRLRMNSIHRDHPMSSTSFLPAPTVAGGHPDIPSVRQPLRYGNPHIDLMSPIPPENVITQSSPVMLRVPTPRRNMQALRWNGAPPNLRPGSSSSSSLSGERDAPLPEEMNPRNVPTRNIAETPMFVPPVEARSSLPNPTSWGLSSGNGGLSRSVASSSRAGSSSGSHPFPGPSWVTHRHPPSQHSRRLSEYVRRSLLSSVGSEIAGQSSSISQHSSGPASSQEGILSLDGGSQAHNQSHPRSAFWLERQGDGVVGIPHHFRAFGPGGEGRNRLVSEIRSVLENMRRGEGLRVEDVMILDQSVIFGMADIHDQHRDMRLDVDNMSYEELLDLEDRIGNVCTGLNEEAILKRMKQRKYIHSMTDDQMEAEPCCICQEQYNDGEDLGALDCGHDFHTKCIKQWLTQKNLCPICKTTALAS